MALASLPQFARAYVISDLHLGGLQGFQMFSSGAAFKKFCGELGKEVSADSTTLLVINGDFVDFLAEPGAAYWNGGQAAEFLKAIAARAPFNLVFDGLRSFLARPGAHLVITLGNHDLELMLPEVRSRLIELLTGGVAARQARIEFAFDGWGYRFQVGHAKALATHGNEVDDYNFTRYDILNQIVKEESLFGISQTAQGWKPNAGTVFVIDAVNRIKERYPFIDLLKPEIPVAFLALTVLAPRNLVVAEDVARLKAAAIVNEATRPSSERRFLNVGDLAETAAEIGQGSAGVEAKIHLLEEKANQYINDPNRNIDDLIYGSEQDELLGMADWVSGAQRAITGMISSGAGLIKTATGWVVDQATEAGRRAHAAALRTALIPFVEVQSFDVRQPSDGDRILGETIRDDYHVVLAGHSHIRRFCARGTGQRGHYVNTGTWAGLMRLLPANVASDTAFWPIYQAMVAGDRQALVDSDWVRQERPVAVLRRTRRGVELTLEHIDETGQRGAFPSEQRYQINMESW
jgi:hypothetical protein